MTPVTKKLIIIASLIAAAVATPYIYRFGDFVYRIAGGYEHYETVPPELPPYLQEDAVLVFSKTNGFRDNDAIAASNQALIDIANRRNWSVYVTENGAVFNPEQLKRFKAVVWNNTSGDLLTTEQRQAFVGYLEKGGGFVGLHGAGGDPHYDWQWYVEKLISAQFIGHTVIPHYQQATIRIEDPHDSIMRGLPERWVRTDEWYSFAKSPRRVGLHVLATLDETTYEPKMFFKDITMGADHPIIWKHCVGNGRAFYSALGHAASTYEEPDHLGLIERAIAWTAGLEGNRCQDGQLVAAEPAPAPAPQP